MDPNDDLLNYELGDDLDDQELAGDEDALLLSDEEAQLDFEDELPPEKPQIPQKTVPDRTPPRTNNYEDEVKVLPESNSSRDEHQPQHCQSTVSEQDPDDDRVSSTNECGKEAEEDQHPPDSNASDTSPTSRRKEEFDYSSYDNDDEPRERHNPKTTSEREQSQQQHSGANEFSGRNQGPYQRGGRGSRGGGPPFRGGRGGFNRGVFPNNNNSHPGPNQFYGNDQGYNPMNNNGGPPHGPPGHGPMPMMNNRMPGPPQMMHRPQGGMRPDFHPHMQQGNFGRPPFPNDGPRGPMMRPPHMANPPQPQQPHFGGGGGGPMYRPHPRMPDHGPRGRPPFQQGPYVPNNFNNMNGPPQPYGGPMQPMAPYPQQMPPQQPMTGMPQGPNLMGGGSMMGGPGMPPVGHNNPAGMAPVIPRKVLINPNFKGGGVEAATNQLMKDTMGGAQLLPSPMSDEALLRQQEEFINKNRMHIEKRRHDRSPSPRKRDYSPPPHRDHPRSGVSVGGNSSSRYRRGHSPNNRDSGRASSPKRRRSTDGPTGTSSSRDTATAPPEVEEDEETRAYRLKIEKQKAMRDKILRDKEMRRRKAAEQKEGGAGGEEASVQRSPNSQSHSSGKTLKPLVVTQKKIISLKGKSTTTAEPVESKPVAKRVVVTSGSEYRSTGNRLTETVAAQVKPVVIKRSLENDSDEFDEDELLADSPPPAPAARSLTPPVVPATGTTVTRRVVLTSAKQASCEGASKGVFDRLEKRVGVTDMAKKKLKRIVIKHLE